MGVRVQYRATSPRDHTLHSAIVARGSRKRWGQRVLASHQGQANITGLQVCARVCVCVCEIEVVYTCFVSYCMHSQACMLVIAVGCAASQLIKAEQKTQVILSIQMIAWQVQAGGNTLSSITRCDSRIQRRTCSFTPLNENAWPLFIWAGSRNISPTRDSKLSMKRSAANAGVTRKPPTSTPLLQERCTKKNCVHL
jgi:hypothetical protein